MTIGKISHIGYVGYLLLLGVTACNTGDPPPTVVTITPTAEPSPQPSDTPISVTSPTQAPPTPTQVSEQPTAEATPIGGEPEETAVDLDCPKTYTAPLDQHVLCTVVITTDTVERHLSGEPTGQTFEQMLVLVIDLSESGGERCMLRHGNGRWVSCAHVEYRELE